MNSLNSDNKNETVKTYSVSYICKNCGAKFSINISFGALKPSITKCEICGCKAARPDSSEWF